MIYNNYLLNLIPMLSRATTKPVCKSLKMDGYFTPINPQVNNGLGYGVGDTGNDGARP